MSTSEYLQGLLADRLSTEAAAGQVRLSPVDGLFGPITEGSVTFFQRRAGLAGTGVVDEATWTALEATPVDEPAGQPLRLRIPFELWLRWQDTTVLRMVDDFHGFDLGLDNEAEFGVRPLRDVKLFLRGQLNLHYTPRDHSGEIDWCGGAHLRWRFDLVR